MESLVLSSTVDRPEPILLFDQPRSVPLTFDLKASGNMVVTFSTIVSAPESANDGHAPFEYLLWVDDGPAPTMPVPANLIAQAGGTPVSTTHILTLKPGPHLVQVVVRSPSGVSLSLSHSHLTTLYIPTPAQ
jgi:hypothetical protein